MQLLRGDEGDDIDKAAEAKKSSNRPQHCHRRLLHPAIKAAAGMEEKIHFDVSIRETARTISSCATKG